MLRFKKDSCTVFTLETKFIHFSIILSLNELLCLPSCSYYVEKRSRKGKAPVSRRSNTSNSSIAPSGGGSSSDLFIVAVSLIAEMMRVAKQSEEGGAHELDRYMTVYFDYSTENDIPTMLSLASRWVWHIDLDSQSLKGPGGKNWGKPRI